MKKRTAFLLLAAALLLAGPAGCGTGGAAPARSAVASGGAAEASSATGSAALDRAANLPPNTPGPFAVYSGARPDTLDIYTEEGGAYLVSLPYSMLEGFPATEPWSPSPPGAPALYDGLHAYCGSIGDFVWAALGSGSSGGMAFNAVRTSADGGKTWREGGAGATNADSLAGLSTGANFASPEIGFLCFDAHGANGSPGIARTLDGGATWERLRVDIPADMREYAYFTPQCPLFTGNFGVIPTQCMNRAADAFTTEYLISTDGGRSWRWERPPQE